MHHIHALLPACLVNRCALTVVVLGAWNLLTVSQCPILSSLSEDWPTVKPVTALCFIAAGLAMLYDNNGVCRPWSRMLCVFILTVMGSSFAAHYQITPVEQMPSLLDVACFTLFSVVILGNGQLPKRCRRFAAHVLMLVATGAVAGYALGYPSLYGYSPGISSGMALLAAMGLLTLGLGLRERGLEYERRN